ncbi:MAG: hypothetical protein ABL858_04425 [Candidatus Nitrotoga sp.]
MKKAGNLVSADYKDQFAAKQPIKVFETVWGLNTRPWKLFGIRSPVKVYSKLLQIWSALFATQH